MKKLAIITSHPIQYNAPLFRLLTERNQVQIKVFYTWGQTKDGLVYDPDFKREFKWDIPLLEGYEQEFVENISTQPSAGNYRGIKNRDLIQRIDRYSPDAILMYGWSFQSHLQAMRHFKGKTKMLFRGDSTLLDEKNGFSSKKTARRLFLKWVYRHIDIALYTGEANLQYYLKHGVKKYQLRYAAHAVENERFFDLNGTNAQKAIEWRKELNLAENDLVFLFAGKLEPKKDPTLLIEAFKEIQATSVRLVIVGNGVLETSLKQSTTSDPRIIFLDFQNQQKMPVVYRLADVFVLPSAGPGETWGLSVNEAMASNRPVIVSDKCGCAVDLVKGNGLIFEAGNKAALKEALVFFINHPEERKKMAAIGLDKIRHFSFNDLAKAIETVV